MLSFSKVIKFFLLIYLFAFNLEALPIHQNVTSKLKENPLEPDGQIQKAQLKQDNPLDIPKFETPKNFNLKKVAEDIKAFGFEGLRDEKHIEALPLDRQGRVNPEFHKEIFLGNHELFENEIKVDENKRRQKLTEIFHKADVDHSQGLTKLELLDYVHKNIQDHLDEAKEKNKQLFLLIDTDQDGKITWHEYFALYIKFHHMNVTNTTELEKFEFNDNPADSNLQRELVKIRYRWVSADKTADNYLDIDEFLAFRHPEMSGNSFGYVVQDLILQLDRNGDRKLDINEFAFVPREAPDSEFHDNWEAMNARWLKEQKEEFHEMDANEDGTLTEEELYQAYDPMNRGHIQKKVKSLFSLVDISPKDDLLSLKEIIKNAKVFTDMHILDAEKVLHEEM